MENDGNSQKIEGEETILLLENETAAPWTDEQEQAYQRGTYISIALYGGVICLLVILLGGFYRVAPLLTKIQGTWLNHDQGHYVLEVKGDSVQLEMKTYKDIPGVSLWFKGSLQGTKPNRYQGQDVSVELSIDKAEMAEKDLVTLRKQTTTYKIVSETSKQLVLQYSEEAIAELFDESHGVESTFYLRLQEFGKGLNGQELLLRNQQFAKEGMRFERKGK